VRPDDRPVTTAWRSGEGEREPNKVSRREAFPSMDGPPEQEKKKRGGGGATIPGRLFRSLRGH